MTKDFEVPIHDSVNKWRVLGYFKNPPGPPRDYVTFAVLDRQMAASYLEQIIPECSITTLTLKIEWSYEDSGYTRKTFFTTDAPLETLSKLCEFRFPGETWEAAHHRAYYG